MRINLVILIFFICLSSLPAMAADVIMGTVQSIDRDRGELALKVMDSSADDLEEVIVKADPEELSSISVGKVIRVWGNYESGMTGTFQAESITGRSLHGRKHDPTGVRSRLGRGGHMSGRGGMGGRGHAGHK